MLRIRHILALLLVLVLLAGCAGSRAATSAPFVPTSAPVRALASTFVRSTTFLSSTTVTPAPIRMLPDWVMKYIGIGVSVNSIDNLMPDEEVPFGNPVYRLAGGGFIRFEYSDRVQDMPIVSRIQVEGKAAVVPVSDAKPVDDFRVALGGGLSVAPHDALTLKRLKDALGAPVNDVATVFSSVALPGRFLERTLDFQGLEVSLRQEEGATDKTLWSVESVSFSTSAQASARGLKVGMTLAQVQKLFATDETCMYVLGSKDGLYSMGIGKNQTYMDWDGPVIGVTFLDDRVVGWSVAYTYAT